MITKHSILPNCQATYQRQDFLEIPTLCLLEAYRPYIRHITASLYRIETLSLRQTCRVCSYPTTKQDLSNCSTCQQTAGTHSRAVVYLHPGAPRARLLRPPLLDLNLRGEKAAEMGSTEFVPI